MATAGVGGDGEAVVPGTSVGAVFRCSFGWWYPRLRSVSLKAESVRVPSSLVEWLRSDGVALGPGVLGTPGSESGDEDLPRGLGSQWTRDVGEGADGGARVGERAGSGMPVTGSNPVHEEEGEDEEEEDEEDEEEGWSDVADPVAPDFPGLERWMEGAIERLGGAVMPKLSWSCPKDATWVSPYGSLMCTTPGEVFLLLKCSESVLHDVEHAFANCVDAADGGPQVVGRGEDVGYPEGGGEDDVREELSEAKELEGGEGSRGSIALRLVLKKWQPGLLPSNEFRCFVRGGELIAVSQRDVTVYYEHLGADKERYGDALVAWHDEHVSETMEDEDYVLDVYVTRACRCYLVDINPYGGETLPLLFTWGVL